MILKILIIGAVIAAVYFLFFKTKPEAKVTKKNTKKDSAKPDADEMVECASCGVYAEIQECILSNGKYYCSRECLQKGK
ncbi:PP0621 family protein [Sulfurimonas sp. NW15]|uniref:PP0621 family protein n=1 Tax=unclassified Sulfurimonas TaxID=2623549 RepID=UPI003DA93E46